MHTQWEFTTPPSRVDYGVRGVQVQVGSTDRPLHSIVLLRSSDPAMRIDCHKTTKGGWKMMILFWDSKTTTTPRIFFAFRFVKEKNLRGADEISENDRDNKIKDQHNKWILTPQKLQCNLKTDPLIVQVAAAISDRPTAAQETIRSQLWRPGNFFWDFRKLVKGRWRVKTTHHRGRMVQCFESLETFLFYLKRHSLT